MADIIYQKNVKYTDLPAYKYKLINEVIFRSADLKLFVLYNKEEVTYQKLIHLDLRKGELKLLPGFSWDGPSGPVPDIEILMFPSLIHDALYFLMRAKVITGVKSINKDNWQNFNKSVDALSKKDKALYQEIINHHKEQARYLADVMFADLCTKNSLNPNISCLMRWALTLFAASTADPNKPKEYPLLIADSI